MSDQLADAPVASDSITHALSQAGLWFLRSGIQDSTGGVARYYRAAEQRNLPVSTEITGYSASFYSWMARTTGQPIYLSAAERTVQFLVQRCWMPEAASFPFECSPQSPSYFFDCGIIVRGLLSVWRATGNNELLEIAEACGRSMARDFLTDVAIHPIVSLPERRALAYEKRWSREPGCFQLKSALAWRDLGVVTGHEEFHGWWDRALTMSLAQADRFLPGAEEPEKVMDRLHAYSYFLEALQAEPERPTAKAAVAAGIHRVEAYLREIAPRLARADVYAQLLRVRLLAEKLGIAPLDLAKAEEEAEAIAEFQYDTVDTRLDGGFCFGTRGGERLPFANPVTTAFCAQALAWWQDRSARHGAGITLDELI